MSRPLQSAGKDEEWRAVAQTICAAARLAFNHNTAACITQMAVIDRFLRHPEEFAAGRPLPAVLRSPTATIADKNDVLNWIVRAIKFAKELVVGGSDSPGTGSGSGGCVNITII
jgi:hypothetical protein